MQEKSKTNMRKIKISLQELLYYAYFSCLLFGKGIGLYEGMAVFNLCIVLALALIGFKFLITEYTAKEWIGIVLVMLCSVIAYLRTGEKAVIFSCLTVLGIKNVPLKRILKIAFFIWTITFYGMLIVHLLGWKEEIVLAHNKFGLGFILRHSLGFPHPNVLHLSFFIWMALLLYLFPMNRKQLIKISAFLFLENIFIFLYSISITGFLLAVFYLMVNFYFAVKKDFCIVERLFIRAVLPLCILISIIPPLLFQGKLYEIVNKVLNTRLKIWKYYLTTFSPSLFGTRVWSPSYEKLSMDCSYLYLLYYYGIILFVLFLVLFAYVIEKYMKENRKKELAIILGMLVAGITEPYLFNFSFKNIILIFAGDILFTELSKRNKKETTILATCNRNIEVRGVQRGEDAINRVKVIISHFSQRSKGLLMAVGIMTGIAGFLFAYISYQSPDCIYVRSDRCDYVKGEGITLDKIQEETSLIYGYIDAETRFYGFDGNMITLERIRVCITGAIGGFLVGTIFILVVLCYTQLEPCRKREVL